MDLVTKNQHIVVVGDKTQQSMGAGDKNSKSNWWEQEW